MPFNLNDFIFILRHTAKQATSYLRSSFWLLGAAEAIESILIDLKISSKEHFLNLLPCPDS